MAAKTFGTATAAIGLPAIAARGLPATVFEMATRVRDTIHLAMSENEKEIANLLEENKAEFDLLVETYNDSKELLDQHKLTEDLEQLLAEIVKLYTFLDESKDEKPVRELRSLEAILPDKLETLNNGIVRIRTRWKECIDSRTLALLSRSPTETIDRLDHRDGMQTNAPLTIVETIRAEAAAVVKVIQQATVQRRARSLSMHSQVEPDGFRSLTTRVAIRKSSSLVTCWILSPDASLSDDTTKMCLEEYSQILNSDSPTIKFFTKNGKTIVCRKQADEMEVLLEEAKELLQDMVEAKDVPTIKAIHRLRILAGVLDRLGLPEECILVGDCAINLARAFGSRAVEFQKEQAQTISLIAGLGGYRSQACPLFAQAISVCDAFVMEDGSDSAKLTLLEILDHAGPRVGRHPALGAQWLSRAMQLITELPSAMVTDELRGSVYLNYGWFLNNLKEDSKALVVRKRAVAIYRSLASGHGRPMHKDALDLTLHKYGGTLYTTGCVEDAPSVARGAISPYHSLAAHGQDEHREGLAIALRCYGGTLHNLGQLKDALRAIQEAVPLFRTLTIHGQDEHSWNLANVLSDYAAVLYNMGHLEDALSVGQEAVPLFRTLAVHGKDGHKRKLANVLHNYRVILHTMGHLEDTLSVEQEIISLRRTLAVHKQDEYKRDLATALSDYGVTLSKMGRPIGAFSVRKEVIYLYRSPAIHAQGERENGFPIAVHNHRSTRHNKGYLEEALHVRQEAVSLFRSLTVCGQDEHKEDLAQELGFLGGTLAEIGSLKEAVEAYEEAIALYRPLISAHLEKYGSGLAKTLINYGTILSKRGYDSKILDVDQEAVSLSHTLATQNPRKHKHLLAISHYNLGASFTDLCKYPEAAVAFQKASSLCHVLCLQGSPEHQGFEVKSLLNQCGVRVQSEQYKEAADLVQQAVVLYRFHGQNKGLLWRLVHQHCRLLQYQKKSSTTMTNGQTSCGCIAKYNAILIWKLAEEVEGQPNSAQDNLSGIFDSGSFKGFQCDPDIVDCQCQAVLDSIFAIPDPTSTELDSSMSQHQLPSTSFKSVEPPIIQKEDSIPLLPSETNLIFGTDLSPLSSLPPGPLARFRPSLSIYSEAMIELDPTSVAVDPTPTRLAVIEDSSVSEAVSDVASGTGRKPLNWIKDKLRVKK